MKNANECYVRLPKSLLTPFQLKNIKRMRFDSYLSKKSEFGVGEVMGSLNKEYEEVKEMRELQVVSPKTQATISPRKWKKKGHGMERKDEMKIGFLSQPQ